MRLTKEQKEAIIGKVFGKLTVTGISHLKYADVKTLYECKCNCGNMIVITRDRLISGHTKSCGCIVRTLNGLWDTPEHKAWRSMLDRCFNQNNNYYHYYGGRGISVCKQWKDNFLSFYKDMGPRPSENHSLDREDNNDGYHPNNCRWATSKEQANNKRNNVYLFYRGIRYTKKQLSELTGIDVHLIDSRLKAGKTIEEAITLGLPANRNK